jgi:glycine/D-amino acid oxidase-like deaminating enzyme/nitrite reductase/ring-hydroxylating ferredoxin subunit
MLSRDGSNTSLWQETSKIAHQIHLQEKADVIIVGGGITGITTGLLLQKAGIRCMILEAKNLGFGTTGGTTAHLNTLLDTPYSTMIKDFGVDHANLVARGAEEALMHIHTNIERYHIECGYEVCKGFLFAQNESQDEELQKIFEACKTVGLPVSEEYNLPVPIDFTRAISVEGQSKFHPLMYIFRLADEFVRLGGIILENTRVTGVEEEAAALKVETGDHLFLCDKLIYATHVPPGINLIHLRYIPLRSYALAVTLKMGEEYPRHLAYDLYDPYHYYRTQTIDGTNYLIVGGEDHKTGDHLNTEVPFAFLEAHVRKYFKVDKVTHRWSSQFYETTDGLPYIGVLPGNSNRFLVATGFGGNGMTYGTLSALILKSILLEEDNPLISLFSPSRIKPIAGFKSFVEHNTGVLKEVLSKFFSKESPFDFADLAPTEGKVMEWEGQKVGVFKDEIGTLHAVDAGCSHMGCTVSWNQTEKSWDCPCHGTRYSVKGTVLNGPSDRNLTYLTHEILSENGKNEE